MIPAITLEMGMERAVGEKGFVLITLEHINNQKPMENGTTVQINYALV